jgi:glycosyltransferase involved in cell wall biosynthesis
LAQSGAGRYRYKGDEWVMLNEITPVLLTFNEAENIGRTLSRLEWAKDIVVVDSGSTDETVSIVARSPQARVFYRAFDTHANQWRYAVEETGIRTSWILRLDADYEITEALKKEVSLLDSEAPVNGYCISFDYAIFGQKLVSSLYPPNTILMRMGQFSVRDEGHTERWTVRGPVKELKARIIHNDWKSIEHWVSSQGRYMRRELSYVRGGGSGVRGALRRYPPFMPLATLLYCLLVKGLIMDGRAGIFYALQRLVAESVLALMLLEEELRGESETAKSE